MQHPGQMQGRGIAAKSLVWTWAGFCLLAIGASAAQAAPPTIEGLGVSGVSSDHVTLEAKVNPKGVVTRYHFDYGLQPCSKGGCVSTPEGQLPAGSEPVPVMAKLEGLPAATAYHFRLVAENTKSEDTESEDNVFATYSLAQNGPPDGRVYEQASPVDKNGEDIVGSSPLVKAADNGSGISFGSDLGIPGGVGSQGLPLYLARREGEGAGGMWSTRGLFPPERLGERAVVLGWLPDFSEAYATVTVLGDPRTKAFLVEPTDGSEPIIAAPYSVKPEYAYIGTSADRNTVLFEARAKLPPKDGAEPISAALSGFPNIYAWDRETGELSLASILEDGKSPARGVSAGALGGGTGTENGSYLQDSRAVIEDGSVFFTARGSGQLYERVDPTLPSGEAILDGEGREFCEAGKSCTVHISASEKSNGASEDGSDPAGPQPAHFWAASKDGSEVFFTSREKLTNDANTGPEQPSAAIGRAGPEGESPKESFLPTHALGMATDSEHIYWVDPTSGAIARSDLEGSPASIEDPFIDPGPVHFEWEEEEHGVPVKHEEDIESKPRYVAVDSEYVYWTNSGRTDKLGHPIEGEGTIGRAPLADPEAVEPACIRGASDPQGIGVGNGHVYWANRGSSTIGRAKIDCTDAEQSFHSVIGQPTPHGLAVDPTGVYFTESDEANNNGYVTRIPFEGGVEESLFIGKTILRGISLSTTDLYWASKGESAIGTVPIADFKANNCKEVPTCKKELVKLSGLPEGVATDPTHVLWSVNGEAPTNPGNDLYSFDGEAEADKRLTDLTVEQAPGAEDGAEAQGVLGSSADGRTLYFAANGVLAANKGALGTQASQGDCTGQADDAKGSCNLYALHEGATSFIAPLTVGSLLGDAYDWVQVDTGGGIYHPRPSFTSPDGETLLFRSREKLIPYDNHGIPELYRYREGEGVECVSCDPSGEAPEVEPRIGAVEFPGLRPIYQGIFSSRILSASGDRVVFETPTALAEGDVNNTADVYEWEAPGTGSCGEGGPGWAPLDGGCVSLISSGKEGSFSQLADASASGDDIFFFTRDRLVGQDGDELKDVYDARVEGGITAQNPPLPPAPCESPEACRPVPPHPPEEGTSGSAAFHGPPNPKPKRAKPKHHKNKAKKNHRRGRAARSNRGAGK